MSSPTVKVFPVSATQGNLIIKDKRVDLEILKWSQTSTIVNNKGTLDKEHGSRGITSCFFR